METMIKALRFQDTAPVTENQMEKNMKNEMNTGIMSQLIVFYML